MRSTFDRAALFIAIFLGFVAVAWQDTAYGLAIGPEILFNIGLYIWIAVFVLNIVIDIIQWVRNYRKIGKKENGRHGRH